MIILKEQKRTRKYLSKVQPTKTGLGDMLVIQEPYNVFKLEMKPVVPGFQLN